MSPWSHLANAKHIDRIIADPKAKANPKAWDAPWDAAWDAARVAAWVAAWDAAWVAAWVAARGAVRDAAWDAAFAAGGGAARDAARGAISALVAWDRAGGLMDLPAEQVKVLAILGDQAAILMYPAIVADFGR